MARSVVLNGTTRCPHCRLPPRWCICAGFRTLDLPLQVDVLIHSRESFRPSSTGRLINRVVPASRGHIYRHDLPLKPESIVQPGRTLLILHPQGQPLPADTPPERLQALLLDGSWREAARMMHEVKGWGLLVNLPMSGTSRYALRAHQGEGKYSTIEALLFLLGALGLPREQAELRLQFELHVYAGLRSRGEKDLAREFLAESPIRSAFPELLEHLNDQRGRSGVGESPGSD